MARLRVPAGRPAAESDGSDRGQFLLIGAFGIAVLLLVFAGVLNTVTYTEGLAAQTGEHTTSRDVAALQEDVRRGVAGLVERVNDGSGDYDAKERRFTGAVRNLSEGIDREQVLDATGVAVRVRGTTEGGRITQSSDRALTNVDGAGAWDLADSVDGTRRFELTLDRNSLYSGDCSSGFCYGFVVDDGGSAWRVSVSRSTVTVDGPASDCAIRTDGNSVTIDVVDGTVEGERCGPLSDIEAAASYELRYVNGDNATGTYRLELRDPAVDERNYDDDGSPSATPIIYAAQVEVSYRNPQLSYTKEFLVSGGGRDA